MESLNKPNNWEDYTPPDNDDLDFLEKLVPPKERKKAPVSNRGSVCIALELLGFKSSSNEGYWKTRQRMREIISTNPNRRITPLNLIAMLNKEGLIRAGNPYYTE